MPIKLLELEDLLQTEARKQYSFLERKLKDYDKEYERILEARKKEFKNAPRFLGVGPRLYNEKDYPYSIFNKLTAKQVYHIDKGEVGIRTEEFLLPVTHLTEVEKVEIFSSAEIPCGCWEGVRKKIAEDNELMVGDNEFYARVDSLFKVEGRILYVKDAKERLVAGIQKDFNSKLELTKI